jgi:hypothetical protein
MNTDFRNHSALSQSKPAKWPTALAIVILLFSILFCAWGGMSLFATRGIPVVYWLVTPNIYVVLFLITALGIGLLALMVTRIFRRFQFGLFVIAVVFSCVGLFSFYWGSWVHQDSIAFNSHVYHLALRNDSKWSDYILCECDSWDVVCRCHAFYSRYTSGRSSTNTLSIDNTTNELWVNAGKDVDYIYGATQHCFSVDGYCHDK